MSHAASDIIISFFVCFDNHKWHLNLQLQYCEFNQFEGIRFP